MEKEPKLNSLSSEGKTIEGEKINKFFKLAEERGIIGNPFPTGSFDEALEQIHKLPNIEIEDYEKGDTEMRLHWHDEKAEEGGCISIPSKKFTERQQDPNKNLSTK